MPGPASACAETTTGRVDADLTTAQLPCILVDEPLGLLRLATFDLGVSTDGADVLGTAQTQGEIAHSRRCGEDLDLGTGQHFPVGLKPELANQLIGIFPVGGNQAGKTSSVVAERGLDH